MNLFKLKLTFLILFLFIIFPFPVLAKSNGFVSVVNPVRGTDFWDQKNQDIWTSVNGEVDILKKFNLKATWLLRFDALSDKKVTDLIKRGDDEAGLFLEITPSWTKESDVKYHNTQNWHDAGSAFLSGYERPEREKLIDESFGKFKQIFGYFPKSVGAWWIDSYSLGYMQQKYGILAALIVSDQYTTDNYQIWGQYFGTPYYPAKNNALHPASSKDNKLPVVVTQWAARDPVNGYGDGVQQSTFSVQVNDYTNFHNLDTKYFSSLVDIYTNQKFNQFGHLVVGLENSYSWNKYANEYENQIKVLADKQKNGDLTVMPLKDFASWYEDKFPDLSPDALIVANDPLGTDKKAVWYMNPFYRVGWFYNKDGSVFRDIRQYVGGEEEMCFQKSCPSVNFATFATRVLDDVSFGQKWVIDQGKISKFKVEKSDKQFVISYKNEAENIREIGLLPRDISVDGKIFSIDGAILNVIKKEEATSKTSPIKNTALRWSVSSAAFEIIEFFLFLLLVLIFPGIILTNEIFMQKSPPLLKLFLSTTVGFVVFTLLFYISSIFNVRFLIFIYILLCLIIFVRFGFFKLITEIPKFRQPFNFFLAVIILAGTAFQVVPTFRSGLNFSYGVGFWGPNTHDGIWHLALINQLAQSVPPVNPIYSGIILKNYHFFYDLLVSATNYLTKIPVSDLLFRFYPTVFSLMLGLGSYFLIMKLFETRLGKKKVQVAAFLSIYLIYFAGSFGWIVEFLRQRDFGGESAFWVNQSVSLNLNPPFAISLVILITLLYIMSSYEHFKLKGKLITIILCGALISFKSYTGILFLGSLAIMALVRIITKKDFSYCGIFLGSLILSSWLFLSNFQAGSGLIVFAPFWFVNSMIDSPDRVGWIRLSLARVSSQSLAQWPKFILVEVLSLMLFIFGNLGFRFFSFGSLFKLKEISKDESLLLIFVVTILSIIIPILFIQSGNPWNTIQFFYPALYTTALFSGVMVSVLVFKLNKFLAAFLIVIFLILAPINSFATARGYLIDKPHAFISSKELEGLKFLSNQPQGVVLTYPYNEKLKQKLAEPWPILAYDSTAYVSAFSKKNVYLEDEPQNQILLTDYKKRLISSEDFFLEPISKEIKFLQDNKIKYIYLPKIYNIKLETDVKFVKNIFENDEVSIFKIN